MKVIYKAPGCQPEPRDIPNTLEELQAAVGGYIGGVAFASDTMVICNKEGRQRVDSFPVHDVSHHFSSYSSHAHFREFQLSGTGREHHAEHFSKDIFFDVRLMQLLDNVQSPEGEKDRYLLSGGSCAISEHKGS